MSSIQSSSKKRTGLILIGFFSLIALAVLALLLLLLVRDPLVDWARNSFGTQFRPDHAFGDRPHPPVPDYSDGANWLAWSPNGTGTSDQAADIFWVHPTTFFDVTVWNAAADAELETDHLQTQASVFDDCCRLFAPHYRQATFYALWEFSDGGRAALDLAYQDVEAAFDHYLTEQNDGRPFVLAGHSQGSALLDRLIREKISGTPLESQLVVAYLIGYHIDGTNGTPICDAADQIGCHVSWNTTLAEFPVEGHTDDDICVNPLSWRHDNELVGFEKNLGTLDLSQDDAPLESDVVDGRCQNNRLEVTEIRSDYYSELYAGTGGELHEYDYALYYVNLEENVAERISVYLEKK